MEEFGVQNSNHPHIKFGKRKKNLLGSKSNTRLQRSLWLSGPLGMKLYVCPQYPKCDSITTTTKTSSSTHTKKKFFSSLFFGVVDIVGVVLSPEKVAVPYYNTT
jgi:hypothetical protein